MADKETVKMLEECEHYMQNSIYVFLLDILKDDGELTVSVFKNWATTDYDFYHSKINKKVSDTKTFKVLEEELIGLIESIFESVRHDHVCSHTFDFKLDEEKNLKLTYFGYSDTSWTEDKRELSECTDVLAVCSLFNKQLNSEYTPDNLFDNISISMTDSADECIPASLLYINYIGKYDDWVEIEDSNFVSSIADFLEKQIDIECDIFIEENSVKRGHSEGIVDITYIINDWLDEIKNTSKEGAQIVKDKIGQFYLPFINRDSPMVSNCRECKEELEFFGSSYVHVNLGSRHVKIEKSQYQCQDCGKLEFSDEESEKGICVALKTHCECGGQFRRDKNVFCPYCDYRKNESNQSENYYSITESELEVLEKSHGQEVY